MEESQRAMEVAGIEGEVAMKMDKMILMVVMGGHLHCQ